MVDKILKFFQNQSNNRSKVPLFLSMLILAFIVGYTIINTNFTFAEVDPDTLKSYRETNIAGWEKQIEKLEAEITELEEKIAYETSNSRIQNYEKQIEKKNNEIEKLQEKINNTEERLDDEETNFSLLKSPLESIGSFIFSAILAFIGSLLWGISTAAYSFLGNDYLHNFINFSLNFASIGGSAESIANSALSLLTNLAFSLVVLFVLKNILLNYILWRGNPNENPLEIIIGIAMCVAMISGFSEIYAGISSILGNLVTSISGNSNINFADIPGQMVYSATGIRFTENTYEFFQEMATNPGVFAKQILVLLLSLYLFIKLLQALISAAKAGLELLALKVAAPMFCLSLLNNNVSGFGSYLKEICKRFFGIMLRVAAINLALGLLSNASGSIIFTICGAFACIAVIENAGQFLSGIVTSVGGGSEVNSGMRGAASLAGNITGGIKSMIAGMGR